jgi:hypothetical protein
VRAEQRGAAAVLAALTDSEIRRLARVEVSQCQSSGRPGLTVVRIEMLFESDQKVGYPVADSATLSPADVNAALAERAEKLARAQRPG